MPLPCPQVPHVSLSVPLLLRKIALSPVIFHTYQPWAPVEVAAGVGALAGVQPDTLAGP
jgi:hypothetical protein